MIRNEMTTDYYPTSTSFLFDGRGELADLPPSKPEEG